MPDAEPDVIGQTNSKGGVTKTTTTIQLGHELAARGKRVLLIDGDSQRSATKALALEAGADDLTLYDVLTNPAKGIERAMKEYKGTAQYPITYPGDGGLWLIPGARSINSAPDVFADQATRQPVPSFEQVMPYLIRTFAQHFQYILIDPGPSESAMTRAILFAARKVIAPIAAEPMAIDGTLEMLQTLQEINVARATLCLAGQTELLGILPAKIYPGQERMLHDLQASLDANIIPHFNGLSIPFTGPGWEAAGARVPIAAYAPHDPAAIAYRHLADQIVA